MRREVLRRLKAVALEYGAAVHPGPSGGRHRTVAVSLDGGEVFFLPVSNRLGRASDRGVQNAVAQLRREIIKRGGAPCPRT